MENCELYPAAPTFQLTNADADEYDAFIADNYKLNYA